MGVDIKLEKVSENIDELMSIFEEHYNELEDKKDVLFPFNFNWEYYDKMEKKDSLIFVSARKNGKLIGYCISFIMPSFFNCHLWTCFTHIFYVKKSERKNLAGLKMVNFLENVLEKMDITEWFAGNRLNFDLSLFYKRKGFEPLEFLHRKILRK